MNNYKYYEFQRYFNLIINKMAVDRRTVFSQLCLILVLLNLILPPISGYKLPQVGISLLNKIIIFKLKIYSVHGNGRLP